VTEQKGVNIGNKSYLHNPTEALAYCLHTCPKHKLGCAVDCNIRKVFNEIYDRVIKPHLQKHGDFERELREELAIYSWKSYDTEYGHGRESKIKEVLGEE